MKAGMGPKLNQGLRQGLSQSLVMTPQLVQAIKLLQMSHLELTAHIENELQENPFLEIAESGETAGSETEASGEKQPDAGSEQARYGQDEYETDGTDGRPADLTRENAVIQTPPDADYSNLYQDDLDNGGTGNGSSDSAPYPMAGADRGSGGAFDMDFSGIDARFADEPSLVDHLERQIDLQTRDPILRALARYLAAQLDGAGYLATDPDEIAALFSVDEDSVQTALTLLQACEPAGIGARSLQECLRLQLADQNALDEAMERLLDNLELLGRGDLEGLVRRCDVNRSDLLERIARIRSLNPKPGERFSGPEPESLIPDVIVSERRKAAHADYGFHQNPADNEDDSHWHIELNAQIMPKLLINERYFKTVARNAAGEEKEFLNRSLQSASGLLKALDQRARSILKVAGEIVKQQSAFTDQGLMALRPLTLRQIAEAVDLHESTVSRVTANKYIATPRGIFEMKFFFSSEISGADGDSFSGEAVRYRIRQLIEHETVDAVLSDDALVDLLRADGITIARRTVAKYRESMGLASSAARRRAKRASTQRTNA